MKRLLVAIRTLFRNRFNLDEDKADENAIVGSIRKNVEFKGANLWTLIFAIFIASIGLNVNSTAVIIGAMLISPLMGPIMGIGLGVGINDLSLIKVSLKNLLIAAFFSIATSTLYFWITPLHEAQSEILARTTPSIWDVFIAFFGGFAGIVAGTRKEKTNVIPGVAIATALMPPLCTAGFSLANGFMYYFIGAIYLFFINSVFICISTFLIVRYLKFHKKEFPSRSIEKRVSRTIWWSVILTTVPSVYLAYNIVDRSIFETNAKKFIAGEFHFKRTQVVNKVFTWSNKEKQIDLLLIGEELSKATLDTLRKRLPAYKLKNTELIVRQGLNAKNEIDFTAIKASILQDVFTKTDSLKENGSPSPTDIPDLKGEMRALYPDLISFSLQETVFVYADSNVQDTVLLGIFDFKTRKSKAELSKLGSWLQNRVKADTVRLIVN